VEREVEATVDGKVVKKKVVETVTTIEIEVKERVIDTKGMTAQEAGGGKVDGKSLKP
jgi:hypothetical protein